MQGSKGTLALVFRLYILSLILNILFCVATLFTDLYFSAYHKITSELVEMPLNNGIREFDEACVPQSHTIMITIYFGLRVDSVG